MSTLTLLSLVRNPAGETRLVRSLCLLAGILLVFAAVPALGQDEEETSEGGQDRESMALDSTATQWSYQGAWQVMPNYYDDILDNGEPRPAGNTDYLQLRIVAPVPLKSFTILPRLTLRHYENAAGESGMGNTELFALIIPKKWDWGSGRFGIGPLVTLPGSEKVAKDEWGYGLAAGGVNTGGQWFYGLLFTQSWRSVDPTSMQVGDSDTNPLGIAPFLNYRLPKGWYLGNGDMVLRYNWDNGEFYMPIGLRFGNVIVKPKASWNIYVEYQTTLIKDNWSGSAVKESWRFNVSYTMPVGL